MRSKSPLQADKILSAAARLFANHRFHEARMEDIAALAEVGKGTLYRYFKDKEELYLALLDRAALGLQERLQTALASTEEPREQLTAVVARLIGYFDDHPHLFDLIQHAEAMQRAGQEFPWQKTRNETQALVRGILQEGQKAGVFKCDDIELAVLLLLGGLRAVVRFGGRPRPATLANQIVSSFLDGHGGDKRKPRPIVPVVLGSVLGEPGALAP